MVPHHGVLQMLKTNAMLGMCKKPPLDEKEVMDVAKHLLLREGGSDTWVNYPLMRWGN